MQYPQLKNVRNVADDIIYFTDISTNGLRSKLVSCIGQNYTVPLPRNYSTCDELSLVPKTYLAYKRERCSTLANDCSNAQIEIDQIVTRYEYLINYLFDDNLFSYHTSDPKKKYDYYRCLDILSETKVTWSPRMTYAYNASTLYLNLTTWKDKIPPVDWLVELYKNMTSKVGAILYMSR